MFRISFNLVQIPSRRTTLSNHLIPIHENLKSCPAMPAHLVDSDRHDRGNDAHDDCDGGAGDGDGGDVCAVCLACALDCELHPCGHARCCRRCVVETVCTWRQEGPPRCALCRAPFHAMVFFE